MMRRSLFLLILIALTVPAWAQDQQPAADLDDLLKRIRAGRASDRRPPARNMKNDAETPR